MKKLTLISALAIALFSSCEKEVDPEIVICHGPEYPECVKEHTSHLDGMWVLTSVDGYTTYDEMMPTVYSMSEILYFNVEEGFYTQSIDGISGFPQKFTIEKMPSIVTGKTEDFIVHDWSLPYGWPYDTTGFDSVIAFEPIGVSDTILTAEPSPIVICPGPYRPSFFEIRCDMLYIHSDYVGGATKVYERLDYVECGTVFKK